MSWTTATTYGADYGQDVQVAGWRALIASGGYDTHQTAVLVDALMDALEVEVGARLPEDVTWYPSTSEFVHPVNAELPDADEIRMIFDASTAAVVERLEDIERQVLGSLPATVDDLERELRAIGDPIQRAKVAGMLVDAATRQRVAQIRAEAIWEATRDRSREQVAELLGTGVPAVGKAIWEHNRRRA